MEALGIGVLVEIVAPQRPTGVVCVKSYRPDVIRPPELGIFLGYLQGVVLNPAEQVVLVVRGRTPAD